MAYRIAPSRPAITVIFVVSLMIASIALAHTAHPLACVDGICYRIMIADTPETRARGLKYVENLPDREGMLFVFDSPIRAYFWMHHTRIPLRIVWIDADRRVVGSQIMTPCIFDDSDKCLRYQAPSSVLFALEISVDAEPPAI